MINWEFVVIIIRDKKWEIVVVAISDKNGKLSLYLGKCLVGKMSFGKKSSCENVWLGTFRVENLSFCIEKVSG